MFFMSWVSCDVNQNRVLYECMLFKMGKINLTSIALVLFGLYVLNSLYVLYHFFYIPVCAGGPNACLYPHQSIDGQLEVSQSAFENVSSHSYRSFFLVLGLNLRHSIAFPSRFFFYFNDHAVPSFIVLPV